MVSGPITSWKIDGETVETVETVADFILGGFRITAEGDCSHDIKRHLLLGRKAMTNLDSILKSRDITLPTKFHLVKAMVFPVVMYGCESWTIKKAESWIIDAFERWCWRRLLRVSWITMRSNQSVLKEISTEYSFEGLMLRLKLQYFGHPMQRTYLLEKTLMLGKFEGRRRRGRQRMRWLDGIMDLMDMSLSKHWELGWTGKPGQYCSPWRHRVRHDWATELNWSLHMCCRDLIFTQISILLSCFFCSFLVMLSWSISIPVFHIALLLLLVSISPCFTIIMTSFCQ